MSAVKTYWTSWYSDSESLDIVPITPFKWCITGDTCDDPPQSTICAEIKGTSEEDVWKTVSSFFPINQERFCDLKENPGEFGERFACLRETESNLN